MQDSSSSTTNRPAPPPPRTAPPSGPPLQRSMSSSGPASAVRTRHTEYKMAALEAKKKGDKETAIMYMRIMKQLEPMLSAAESGQAVDLTTLPGPPGTFVLQASPQPKPQPETGAILASCCLEYFFVLFKNFTFTLLCYT